MEFKGTKYIKWNTLGDDAGVEGSIRGNYIAATKFSSETISLLKRLDRESRKTVKKIKESVEKDSVKNNFNLKNRKKENRK